MEHLEEASVIVGCAIEAFPHNPVKGCLDINEDDGPESMGRCMHRLKSAGRQGDGLYADPTKSTGLKGRFGTGVCRQQLRTPVSVKHLGRY